MSWKLQWELQIALMFLIIAIGPSLLALPTLLYDYKMWRRKKRKKARA